MNKPFFNNQFFGIKVPDPNKLLLSNIDIAGTYTSSRNFSVGLTTKEILDSIQKVKEELYDGPPLIKVWVGPKRGGFNLINKQLSDHPLIYENSCIDTNMIYLVAGVGVICGSNAYQRIWEIGYLAIWVEDPPD